MSGQIRWQWPSRLELPVAEEDEPSQLLIVCDALRTIQQPALALGGPAGEVVALARQVRRAVAMFRLTRPELVDLSAQERDVLLLRAGPALLAGATRVTLPGSLPVEFHSRDDYYRPGPEPSWSGAGAQAAQHPGVLEADRPGRGLDRGAVADQVLGAFDPQQLLVAQRGQAGGPAKQPGQGALADAAGRGQLGQRQRVGEPARRSGPGRGARRREGATRCRSIALACCSSPLRRA